VLSSISLPHRHTLAERIDQHELLFVKERLIGDREIYPYEWTALVSEFRRFVWLVGQKSGALAMISPKIDRMWHQLILFTDDYRRFCLDTVGFFINHTPETRQNPIPVSAAQNFLTEYESHFGSVPDTWFSGMSDTLRNYFHRRPLGPKPDVQWSGWTGE
jgi:hypothetical protein